MPKFMPHPATLQLLRFQASARLSRTLHRFRGSRRLALSVLAALLAIVWFGQVAASVFIREPADPRKLAIWIPAGFLAYTIRHLLKTACRTPIEPFEWTAAEQELLNGAPLCRHELVMYRLVAITMAAIAKSACFSLVMLPDLKIWLTGFAGMLLALLAVDLFRMAVEIVAYGMSRKEFIRFRIAVLGIAATGVAVAVMNSMPLSDGMGENELPASLAIGLRVVNSLMDLRTTELGMVAIAPFDLLAGVILAPSFSTTLLVHLAIAVAGVVVLAGIVVWLDLRICQRRLRAEQSAFRQLRSGVSSVTEKCRAGQSFARVPLRLRGAGSLAWRQALGAVHYRTSLCIAMIVPGFLSCLTLLTPQSGNLMLIQLVGGLVFYSFLLLPTAFKFDFRRDVDRLAVLKSLPIGPTAVTLGQLTVPVLLCSLFQLLVLLVAIVVRPYPVGYLLAAMVVLVPTNVCIFSLENLIFLLYPYRLNQEGLGVFIRSILTFTGKGLLFACGLAVAFAWALVARHITTQFLPGSEWGSALFIAGICTLLIAAAGSATALLARVYRRFDISQDTPAAA